MKLKNIISSICVMAMISSMAIMPVQADDTIQVVLNGQELTFDVPPQIIDDYTMVPMRTIFEALGYEVEWNGDNKLITASNDLTGQTLIMTINDKNVVNYSSKEYFQNLNNGASSSFSDFLYEIDIAPMIIEGRTLVPLRAVSELSGCEVLWNGEERKITITAEILNHSDGSIGYYRGTQNPQFEAVTGIYCFGTDTTKKGNTVHYKYPYAIKALQQYCEYLENNGYFLSKQEGDIYSYLSLSGKGSIIISVLKDFEQIWVTPSSTEQYNNIIATSSVDNSILAIDKMFLVTPWYHNISNSNGFTAYNYMFDFNSLTNQNIYTYIQYLKDNGFTYNSSIHDTEEDADIYVDSSGIKISVGEGYDYTRAASNTKFYMIDIYVPEGEKTIVDTNQSSTTKQTIIANQTEAFDMLKKITLSNGIYEKNSDIYTISYHNNKSMYKTNIVYVPKTETIWFGLVNDAADENYNGVFNLGISRNEIGKYDIASFTSADRYMGKVIGTVSNNGRILTKDSLSVLASDDEQYIRGDKNNEPYFLSADKTANLYLNLLVTYIDEYFLNNNIKLSLADFGIIYMGEY